MFIQIFAGLKIERSARGSVPESDLHSVTNNNAELKQLVSQRVSVLTVSDRRLLFAFAITEGLCTIRNRCDDEYELCIKKRDVMSRLNVAHELAEEEGYSYLTNCVRCGTTLGLSGQRLAPPIGGESDVLCHACGDVNVTGGGESILVKLGHDRPMLGLLLALAEAGGGHMCVRLSARPYVMQHLADVVPPLDPKVVVDRVHSLLMGLKRNAGSDIDNEAQGLSVQALSYLKKPRCYKKDIKDIYHVIPLSFLDKTHVVDRQLIQMKQLLADMLGVNVEDKHVSVFVNFVADNGTNFHLDQGPGCNMIQKLGRVVPGEDLVYWLFVFLFKDGAREALNKAANQSPSLREKFPHGLFTTSPFVNHEGNVVKLGELEHGDLLTIEEMQYLAEACPLYSQLEIQKHGDVVLIPSGCAHVVRNVGLGIKIAFDFCDKESLLESVLAHWMVGGPCFGPLGAPDYMNHVHEIRTLVRKMLV